MPVGNYDLDSLVNTSSKNIGLEIKSVRTGKRIGAGDKDKRDLLIHMFWKTGRFSNREIGNRFGLTYSAVSQRAKMITNRLPVDKDLRDQYAMLKSQIKV